ncbi:hypothetical protein PQJ75_20920 [Rhodoplanes sp. TEM]|uniref:Uncharacterized protein n=1 Tax=Rhodoplanes tepidamans TaxID=200616 RepID=A0ABT5JEI1_RHOTP|nr:MULTISPECIES: hypothetical protein [Rhodoplanes]MDC7788083.1 hypothetical protein [Rhodoplanes tepidamans]MDC7986200.1 hypothetical protein [Rhodoplanes sp. TEM]MDQ0355627.1 hypothetical protein [Rhodoplanes tepidamans]
MPVPVVDVRAAVRAAAAYLDQFDDFIGARQARLEETEFDDGSNQWVITLSMIDIPKDAGTLAELSSKRNYRQFRVDAETGHVNSMKVRTLHPIE